MESESAALTDRSQAGFSQPKKSELYFRVVGWTQLLAPPPCSVLRESIPHISEPQLWHWEPRVKETSLRGCRNHQSTPLALAPGDPDRKQPCPHNRCCQQEVPFPFWPFSAVETLQRLSGTWEELSLLSELPKRSQVWTLLCHTRMFLVKAELWRQTPGTSDSSSDVTYLL